MYIYLAMKRCSCGLYTFQFVVLVLVLRFGYPGVDAFLLDKQNTLIREWVLAREWALSFWTNETVDMGAYLGVGACPGHYGIYL